MCTLLTISSTEKRERGTVFPINRQTIQLTNYCFNVVEKQNTIALQSIV